MKEKFFALFVIAVLILFSGCIKTQPGVFKGEIISVQNLDVSRVEASPGDLITLHLDVVNNVEEEISGVRIDIEGSSFLRLESMECDGKRAYGECLFDLNGLDFKHVEANFRLLETRGDQTVRITLTYPYRTYATLSFAIVKPREFRGEIPRYKRFQAPSDLIVHFDPGFLVKRKVNGRVEVVRDYLIYGDEFTLKVRVDGKKYGTSAYLNNVELTLQSLVPLKDSCPDFEVRDGLTMRMKGGVVEVPKELRCDFRSIEFEEPLRSATVTVTYEYEISKTHEEKIRVGG